MTEKETDLYSIQAPHFSVGVEVSRETDRVVTAPPIVGFLRLWRLGELHRYCRRKKWVVEKVKA